MLSLLVSIPLAVLAEGDAQPLQSDWMQLVKGYRDKEARRDTDKRLREAIAVALSVSS